MSLPDTLLIGATDLQSLTGIIVEDLSGLFAPGRRRGDNLLIPYADGLTAVPNRSFAAYTFDVPIVVLEEDASGNVPATDALRRAQMISNLRGVTSAITTAMSTGQGTLTRRLAKSPSGYDEHTCTGEYIDGLAMELLNYHTGRTVLQFLNLTGYWLNGTTPVWP